MERLYVAIIKGPKEYLAEVMKFEKFEINQQQIDSYRFMYLMNNFGRLCSLKEPSEEYVIQYYKKKYVEEWEQKGCSVTFLREDEFNSLYGAVQEFFTENDVDGVGKDHDNEEEEQEEDEWNDWK